MTIVNERVLEASVTMQGAYEVLVNAGIVPDDLVDAEKLRVLDAISATDLKAYRDVYVDVAKRLLVEAIDTILAEQAAGEAQE